MSGCGHAHEAPLGGRRGEGDAGGASPGRASGWARSALIAPIVFYQRFISPGLPRRCRYEPTCSRYAVQAIRQYGILRGLVLAGWRLLRCNPWSPGGFDPVDKQTLFARRTGRPTG